jgi:hypothetical protein
MDIDDISKNKYVVEERRNIPEMSTKTGADKRNSGWIHQMQRLEWTVKIPPVYIPETASLVHARG